MQGRDPSVGASRDGIGRGPPVRHAGEQRADPPADGGHDPSPGRLGKGEDAPGLGVCRALRPQPERRQHEGLGIRFVRDHVLGDDGVGGAAAEAPEPLDVQVELAGEGNQPASVAAVPAIVARAAAIWACHGIRVVPGVVLE